MEDEGREKLDWWVERREKRNKVAQWNRIGESSSWRKKWLVGWKRGNGGCNHFLIKLKINVHSCHEPCPGKNRRGKRMMNDKHGQNEPSKNGGGCEKKEKKKNGKESFQRGRSVLMVRRESKAKYEDTEWKLVKTGTRKKKEERTRYRRGGRAKSVLGQRVWRERERRVIKREDHSSLNFSFYSAFPNNNSFRFFVYDSFRFLFNFSW